MPGQILVDSPKVEMSGAANTVTVFNRDSSYSMLLGGKAVSAAARQEALPFLSNLPLTGHMFGNGTVTRKDGELLVMVQPSIVERSWD
jgi:type II secretory pathway component GspD/PulD (secretin)